MEYRFLGSNNSIVYVQSKEVLVEGAQSALDLMATVYYEKGSTHIILDKSSIHEDFFRLSSGIAGEILQKFINYKAKLAVVGDFSAYTSAALKDFIYECNKGKDIFFVNNLEEAVEKLDSYE